MKSTYSGAPESGALVHLVHWCNICEIDPFFNRGGSSGNTLETECTGYNRSKSGTFKWNLPMKCTWSGAPESGALVHWCIWCMGALFVK